jgi:methylated-DNA-[protein]-cysteine S-methyltransferase
MPSIVTVDSPIGPLSLTVSDGAVRELRIDVKDAPVRGEARDRIVADDAVAQLDAYFAGSLRTFELLLEPRGTSFQRSVWKELAAIPYGTVASYGEIARRVGRPTASRAIGAANRTNPIAVVVPCHRVIGADGSLTGYAGGMWRKEWLLTHEGYALDARVLSRARDGRPAP